MSCNLPTDSNGRLSAYAWPGGYPIVYYFADSCPCCPACANGENGSEARVEMPENAPIWDLQWQIIAADIHWEGPPEICSHCNAEIPSAYGDHENPED